MSGFRFFWKVLLAMLVVAVAGLSVVRTQVAGAVEERRLEAVRTRVGDEARWLATVVHDGGGLARPGLQGLADGLVADLPGRRITLIRADGVVIADTAEDPALMENHAGRPELLDPGTVVQRYSRTLRTEMIYCARPVELDGEVQGHARIAVPAAELHAGGGDVLRAMRGGWLVSLGLALLMALLLTDHITGPLRRVTQALVAMARGDYSQRLPRDAGREVGQLADVVNDLGNQLRDRIDRLERALEQDQAILGSMGDGVVATDGEGRVVVINGSARSLLGAGGGDPRGRPVYEVTRVPDVVAAIDRCRENNLPVTVEARVQHEKGDTDLSISVVPLTDPRGGNRGCVAVLHDLTELRRLERVRRDFVANVSHELKTPLTAVKGYVESVLDDPEMPEKVRHDFLEKAHRNADRLAAIVADLLALARIESSDEEVSFAILDLVDTVRRAMDAHAEEAERKQIELRFSGPGQALPCLGDGRALEVAVGNLVDNAVKYSPMGSQVGVRVWAGDGALWVEVSDQGPGIPPHEQERIFERFYRVDKDRSRALGGTGLGLSIVKNAVTVHGGAVSVDSVVGRGSTFRIRLPATGALA